MAIVDGAKNTAKDVFKGSMFPLIGAGIVYMIIKAYQAAK